MNTDPRKILAEAPLSRLQIQVIFFCICLNALDGFDVLSISFASPGIATEWGIDRAALGIVLSMELIGMAVGSILLGNAADRFGRRPLILGCLLIMASGMALAATATDVFNLSAYRLYTGLGIGGMLAATNAMVAEFSNHKRKSLAVVLMATGYSIGAIIGGAASAVLLQSFDWRSIFIFGAVITAFFLPLVWVFVPESIEYLVQKRPQDALVRINQIMTRMGRTIATELPELKIKQQSNIRDLFSGRLLSTTLLLMLAYFGHIITFYFLMKWIPKIVVDMGFDAASAGGVLVWANIGGATGSVLLGLLSLRIQVRNLVIGALLIAAVMVTAFGQAPSDIGKLALVASLAGFFTNSAIVGLYAIFAQAFPTELRASGTGLVIGVGRGGAVLAPILAGFLFHAGYQLNLVAMVMASGSLVAAVAIWALFFLRKPVE